MCSQVQRHLPDIWHMEAGRLCVRVWAFDDCSRPIANVARLSQALYPMSPPSLVVAPLYRQTSVRQTEGKERNTR